MSLRHRGEAPEQRPAAAGGSASRSWPPALEQAGFESLWVADHIVLPAAIDSRYPFAADGRRDLVAGDALLRRARRARARCGGDRAGEARHRRARPAAAQPGRVRQAGRVDRRRQRRAPAPRGRRRLARGGVRGARRSLRRARRAARGVGRDRARVLERAAGGIEPRSATRPARRCSACPTPARRDPGADRRPLAGRAAPGRTRSRDGWLAQQSLPELGPGRARGRRARDRAERRDRGRAAIRRRSGIVLRIVEAAGRAEELARALPALVGRRRRRDHRRRRLGRAATRQTTTPCCVTARAGIERRARDSARRHEGGGDRGVERDRRRVVGRLAAAGAEGFVLDRRPGRTREPCRPAGARSWPTSATTARCRGRRSTASGGLDVRRRRGRDRAAPGVASPRSTSTSGTRCSGSTCAVSPRRSTTRSPHLARRRGGGRHRVAQRLARATPTCRPTPRASTRCSGSSARRRSSSAGAASASTRVGPGPVATAALLERIASTRGAGRAAGAGGARRRRPRRRSAGS